MDFREDRKLSLANAHESIPAFPRRFSRIRDRCEWLADSRVSKYFDDEGWQEFEKFIQKLLRHCAEWSHLDTASILARVSAEMSLLEEEATELSDRLWRGTTPRPPRDTIEDDDFNDWKDLVQNFRGRLCEKKFIDACRAVEGYYEGGEMMKSLQKVIDSSSPGNTTPQQNDQVLDITARFWPTDQCRNHVFKALNIFSMRFNTLAPILPVRIEGGRAVERGGFGVVSKAHYGSQIVATKAPVRYSGEDASSVQKTKKAETMLRREILLWFQITKLRHEHILPLIGVTSYQFPDVMTVAPWHENGHLLHYVRESKNKDINRLDLLAQVCSALKALHDHVPVVIHADLKCANVLVKQDGTACLADFGLSAVRYNDATLTSVLDGGTARWMAVELFSYQTESPNTDHADEISTLKVTVESDVWSFGMLALEFLTESHPFPDIGADIGVIGAVLGDVRPARPGMEAQKRGLDDELWIYLQKCWATEPKLRPCLSHLCPLLKSLASGWSPPVASSEANCHTITLAIPDPGQTVRHIIGRYGVNVKRLKSDHNVDISVGNDVIITGASENVEAARREILELAEEHRNPTEQAIEMSHPLLHSFRSNKIPFQTAHRVHISFNGNRVTIKGSRDRVDAAVIEIQRTIINLDKHWNPEHPMLELTVSSELARRIHGPKLAKSIGLDDIYVAAVNLSAQQVVTMRGQDDLLRSTEATIRSIDKSKTTLVIPTDMQPSITVARWKQMVIDCGGPEDAQLQALMIEKNMTSPEVTLRGDSQIISALAQKLEKFIDSQDQVYGDRTGTRIYLPTHKRYAAYADPINSGKLPKGNSNSIVKIIGSRENYRRARSSLDEVIRKLLRTTCSVKLPIEFAHPIYQEISQELKMLLVRISPVPTPNTPITPLNAGEHSWKIIRKPPLNPGLLSWTLKADTEEHLSTARTLVHAAIEKARNATHIGFLTPPDKTKLKRIVGHQHTIHRSIEQDTGTSIIHIPALDSKEDDRTIVITGTPENIIHARDKINDALVDRRSTDRLLNPRLRGGSLQASPLPSVALRAEIP